MSASDRILIAGAGPVGYAAALNLATRGIPFILFESGPDIFKDPRAGTIHPPSVEMFDQLGIAKTLIERGYIVSRYHYRDRKQGFIADFDLGLLAEDTPFPFRLMLEQHKVSASIHAKLGESASHRILRNHRVVDVRQDDGGVVATVETPDGVETFDGRYMIGCDGGRSQVRKCMSVAFDGFTYPERFLIVTTPYDFEKVGYAQTNYVADPEEWCALFKVPGADDSGIWRVVFPTNPGLPEANVLDDLSIERRLQGFNPKNGLYDVVHRNLYEVHQRVASSYRDRRVLLAGDAAHINNPLGGMGMNFGFHDAFNLTEKLARIWSGEADEDLLDLYNRQRRTVAVEFLQRQTIDNKKNMEQRDAAARERFHDELRAIVADKGRQRAYLRRVAMIEGVERAASIG